MPYSPRQGPWLAKRLNRRDSKQSHTLFPYGHKGGHYSRLKLPKSISSSVGIAQHSVSGFKASRFNVGQMLPDTFSFPRSSSHIWRRKKKSRALYLYYESAFCIFKETACQLSTQADVTGSSATILRCKISVTIIPFTKAALSNLPWIHRCYSKGLTWRMQSDPVTFVYISLNWNSS